MGRMEEDESFFPAEFWRGDDDDAGGRLWFLFWLTVFRWKENRSGVAWV